LPPPSRAREYWRNLRAGRRPASSFSSASCSPAGSLETLSVESIVDHASCRWDNPAEEIRPLAKQASQEISDNWDNNVEVPDYACDRIAELAGAVLVERE
jgi:hypothetical protein